MAELLFWPALLAYGEAAVAYAGDARRPGSLGRFATWGVRIGWLVQTALLLVQAARADGFPWDTWAGSLNLFVWLVVGAYLIWGCKPRYPAARARRDAARRAPARDLVRGRRRGRSGDERATRRSSSCSTSGSCLPGSRDSRSPLPSRRSTSGRNGC